MKVSIWGVVLQLFYVNIVGAIYFAVLARVVEYAQQSRRRHSFDAFTLLEILTCVLRGQRLDGMKFKVQEHFSDFLFQPEDHHFVCEKERNLNDEC